MRWARAGSPEPVEAVCRGAGVNSLVERGRGRIIAVGDTLLAAAARMDLDEQDTRGAWVRAARSGRGVSSSMVAESEQADEGFCHEAFFYADENEFVAGAAAFVLEGVTSGEPVLVVVSAGKIDLLRRRLKADAGRVLFADMADVGTNPARIIPAWTDFVDEHAGRRLRGIGEPIWAERTPAELVECQRHESLLNVAFAESSGFTLMCPYDTTALGQDVVAEARRSHPLLRRQGAQGTSEDYLGLQRLAGPFAEPLPEPPSSAVDLVFQVGSLGGLRALVVREATAWGLGEERAADAVSAVNEVASNSLRHGGGWGVLRIWSSGDTLIFEVADDGHINEPLVGRARPGTEGPGGRGLWMVNQLCELVQVRSSSTGTTVRMHIRRHRV
jgi:anti-sigma regulatory factor (Ser/Thr protein kinase)